MTVTFSILRVQYSIMKSNHLVFKVTYHIGIDIDNDDDNDDVNYYDYDDEREWYRQ